MAIPIKLKRSAVASKVPLTTDLELGEIAVNTNDGKVYIKKDDGVEAIVEVSATSHIADTANPHSTTLEEARTASNQLAGDVDLNNNDLIDVASVAFNSGQAISWNAEDKTLDVPTGDGPIVQVGQETVQQLYNATGSIIPKGAVVYIVPYGVTGGREHIGLAQADTHETLITRQFIATQEIAIDSTGFCTTHGKIRDIDTSDFIVGDVLYISPTAAGELTKVKPTFPDYEVCVGIVEIADITGGRICVNIRDSYTETLNNFFNGTFRESFNFLVTSNGTVITGTMTPQGAQPDMTMLFSDGFTILDTSPSATLTLTAGTDTAPAHSYVYIPQTTKVLTESTSGWPTAEHIKVAKLMLRSAAITQTDGALVNQNINDGQSAADDQGHLTHITGRLRFEGARWYSGTEGTSSIVTASTPDDVFVAVTAGQVYQLHPQAFPALDSSTGDAVHIINHPTTPWVDQTNLNTQTVDATGTTLNNSSFSFVLWGIANKTSETSHLVVNLPTSSYAHSSPDEAVADANSYSVYDIPQEYIGTGFLIARFTYTYKNDNWVLYSTEDLRGKSPNSTAGGGGAGGGGASTFLALTDTPGTFAGQSGLVAKVNVGETALEFTAESVGLTDIVNDTTPQLGGDLDTADKVITNDTGNHVTVDRTMNVQNLNGSADTSLNIYPGLITGDAWLRLYDHPDSGLTRVFMRYDANIEQAYIGTTTTNPLDIDGLKWPNADGTVDQVMKTDGAGNLGWATVSSSGISDIVEDLTPQLGGNLDVNGKTITSISAGDITITPDTTGTIILDGLNWPQADGTVDQVMKTDGAGNLSFTTISSGGLGSVVEDTTPELGGNLDVGSFNIYSSTSAEVAINDSLQVTGTVTAEAPAGGLAYHTVKNSSGASKGIFGYIEAQDRLWIENGTANSFLIDGLYWPTADGTANQVMKTDGAGNLSFVSMEISNDITPQIGGNLDVGSFNIYSSTTDVTINDNLVVTNLIKLPNSNEIEGRTTDIRFNNDLYIRNTLSGDNTITFQNNASIQDAGLKFLTNSLSQYCSLIGDQDASTITFTNDLSYDVDLFGLVWPASDGTANQVMKTDGAGNLGWTTAAGSSPLTTKGDIFVYGTTDSRLPVGTNDQVLTADSTQTTGMKWADAAAGGGGGDTNAVDMTINQTGVSGDIVQTKSNGTMDVLSGDVLGFQEPTGDDHPNASWNYNYPALFMEIPGETDKFLSIVANSSGAPTAVVGTFNPTTKALSWGTLATVVNFNGTGITYINDPLAMAIDPNTDANGAHSFLIGYQAATGSKINLLAGLINSDFTITWNDGANATELSTSGTAHTQKEVSIDFCTDTTNKHIFAVMANNTSNYPNLWSGNITTATTTIAATHDIGQMFGQACDFYEVKFIPNNTINNNKFVCVVNSALGRLAWGEFNDLTDVSDVSLSQAGKIARYEPTVQGKIVWDLTQDGNYWNFFVLTSGDIEDSKYEDTGVDDICITGCRVNLTGAATTGPDCNYNGIERIGILDTGSPNVNYHKLYNPTFTGTKRFICSWGANKFPNDLTIMQISYTGTAYNNWVYSKLVPTVITDTYQVPIGIRNNAKTSTGFVSPGRDSNDMFIVTEPATESNLDVAKDFGVLTEASTPASSKSVQWDGVYTTTGLTTGSLYYVQPDGSISTASAGGILPIFGKAISTTQLLLTGKDGE